MQYKVKDICEMNASNYNKKDHFSFINYLDTSSITEGKIETIQKLIVGKDKIPSRAKRKVQKNDIIISTVRPNLKHYGIIKNPLENMIVSTGFVVLTPNDHIVNPEYLYWYLTQQHITDYLAGIAETSTTAYPSITADVIGNIEIELPSRDIQDKIANILTALDDKITINDKINKTLKEIAQTIFKRWFIDFEFPNENGEPYKSSGGKFVESELGMIPDGWCIGRLTDIAQLIMGQSPKGDTYNFEGYGLGLVNGASDFKEGKITPLKYTTNPIKISHKGDWIFGVRATVGNVTYVDKEYCLGRGVGVARALSDALLEFLYFQLIKGIDYLEKTIIGSVYINLSKSDLENMKFVIPTKKYINSFHTIVSPFFNKIRVNTVENENLIILRDTLLPKLMSGEMDRLHLVGQNL